MKINTGKPIAEFMGVVEPNGLIAPVSSYNASRMLNRHIGSNVVVRAYEEKYTRSLAQNRLYWGQMKWAVIPQYFDMTGTRLTKEQIHDYNIQHICNISPSFGQIMGRQVMFYDDSAKRPSQYNTKEFSQYMDKFYHEWTTGCGIEFKEVSEKKILLMEDFLKPI